MSENVNFVTKIINATNEYASEKKLWPGKTANRIQSFWILLCMKYVLVDTHPALLITGFYLSINNVYVRFVLGHVICSMVYRAKSDQHTHTYTNIYT